MQPPCDALLALLLLAARAKSVNAVKQFSPKSRHGALKNRVVFEWLDVYSCPEVSATQNMSVRRHVTNNGDVFVDNAWTIVRPAKSIKLIRQVMTKCNDVGTDCEYFMNWNSPMDGCAFIAAKNAIWSPGFANIQPPFECPVSVGRYVNMNWTINKDVIVQLPFPRNHVYKDRLELFNEMNELTFCIVFDSIWKVIKERPRVNQTRE